MPINPEKALGATLPDGTASWKPDDIILYHLGLGAGVPATDAKELEYTYEGSLKVLPSYAVIPTFSTLGGIISVPGLEFNPVMLLHGEQDVVNHRPIPTTGNITTTAKLSGLYDKGKAALAVIEAVSSDADGPLFTNTFSLFLRGEGGFGGERGPDRGYDAPEREPDLVVESPTLPQQALLYRLSGDKNPLHADPSFAAMGGFDKPILHGLCTFGIVCKAAVDAALDGETSKVAGYGARFRGVVFPGETIVTSLWREGDQILINAKTKERGDAVIANSYMNVREA